MVDVLEDPLGVMGNIGGDIRSSKVWSSIVVYVLEDRVGGEGGIGGDGGRLGGSRWPGT